MKAEQGGFDIIIEVLANVNLENDISLLNKKGTIVVRKLNYYKILSVISECSKELEAVKRKKQEGRGEIVNRALYEQLIKPKVMYEAHTLD